MRTAPVAGRDQRDVLCGREARGQLLGVRGAGRRVLDQDTVARHEIEQHRIPEVPAPRDIVVPEMVTA